LYRKEQKRHRNTQPLPGLRVSFPFFSFPFSLFPYFP
jgi:hypothetical protein